MTLFADAKVNLEAIAFQTGSGSSQPKGVMTAVAAVGGSRIASATAATYALADAFSVHAALPARFRNAQTEGSTNHRAFLASLAVIDKTRQLAMAQNSANSVWTDINGNFPAIFLGDNIYEGSSLSTNFTTTGQDILLFGDFSRYYIIDRIGFSTEFIPNTFDQATGRPNASRAWISHWRTGGDCVDTNAFRDLRLS
jgi:HK97 family phage major capsid protein